MTRFDCRRCGRCCKQIGIPWSELDPVLAAQQLEMELDVFLQAHGYRVNGYSGEIEHPEFAVTPCPFLTYDHGRAACRIYPVRPWICRGYPGPGMICAGGRKRDE
ncbi:YkgJ family cysteine cluster protein [Desulfoferrobacter suflitae]|uniref:YkgJ family cysteine cluster protein n=1 Tax=Desulfoferrobacter suflitae TaxID=2865782 RepID=UPI002164B47F|nr:YkgJ family cysteine cluster protein [Desulfoferrobacter suflitae]MCK8601271.1 YkgJ family cysteine cluster protein [Desulfoferrobacter suflitae]